MYTYTGCSRVKWLNLIYKFSTSKQKKISFGSILASPSFIYTIKFTYAIFRKKI